MTSAKTDIYRNNRRIATVYNTGYRLDKLGRKAKGTFYYRVCAAGTTTCSPTVSVTFGLSVLGIPQLLPSYTAQPGTAARRTHRHGARRR